MNDYIWHTTVTSYEELEQTLNELSPVEEVFSINTVGSQAVIITRETRTRANIAQEKNRRLLERMSSFSNSSLSSPEGAAYEIRN